MHLVQVQNPSGMFSNDFIFHVTESEEGAAELKREIDEAHTDNRQAFADAASRGDLEEVKSLLAGGAKINAQQPRGGATALSNAAMRGHLEIVSYLLEEGANVNATNEDGNTALLVAAFMCQKDAVELLLKNDASIEKKNDRGETPIDAVSGEWSTELSGFYAGIGGLLRIDLDLEWIEKTRPQMLELLREHEQREEE